MDFKTYDKAIKQVLLWREKTGKKDYEWPDSRDPEFSSLLVDSGVTGQDVEKALVALTAWREFRGDQYQGMSACVHVLRNRQAKGQFHSHLQEDVTGKNQFSSMTVPGDPNLVKYPEEGEFAFEKLLSNLDDILAGKTVDITQGALYYAVPQNSTSGWFERNIVENKKEHPMTTSIGRTLFYS